MPPRVTINESQRPRSPWEPALKRPAPWGRTFWRHQLSKATLWRGVALVAAGSPVWGPGEGTHPLRFQWSSLAEVEGDSGAWPGALGTELAETPRGWEWGQGCAVHRPVATTWPAGAGAGDGGWAGRWGRAAGDQALLPGSGAASSRRRGPEGGGGGQTGAAGPEDLGRVTSRWVPRRSLLRPLRNPCRCL